MSEKALDFSQTAGPESDSSVEATEKMTRNLSSKQEGLLQEILDSGVTQSELMTFLEKRTSGSQSMSSEVKDVGVSFKPLLVSSCTQTEKCFPQEDRCVPHECI